MFNNQLKKDILDGINLFSFNEATQRLEFRYTGEIKSAIENAYSKNFPDLNLDESTPQGQQITTLTQSFNAVIDYLESCGTSFFMGGSGLFLDYWADTLFNLKRKEAQPAIVSIIIQGVAGTKIPADFMVGDDDYKYRIIDINKEISASGYVVADFEMTEVNDYVAPADTIQDIITKVTGIESVTNPFAAIQGYEKEPDITFYKRAVKFNSTAKNGSFRSILANIAAVAKVRRVGGYENVEDKEVEFKGETIPAHCFSVIVEGGEVMQIIKAITESKGVGAGTYGEYSFEIWNNKEPYTYSFFRPTYVALKVKVVLDSTKIKENTANTIKQNIINYCNLVDFGSLITQPNLINACYEGFIKKDFIVSFEFCRKEDKGEEPTELSTQDLQMLFKEVPIIAVGDIDIANNIVNRGLYG